MKQETASLTIPAGLYVYPAGWRGVWRHFCDQLNHQPTGKASFTVSMMVSGAHLAEAKLVAQEPY